MEIIASDRRLCPFPPPMTDMMLTTSSHPAWRHVSEPPPPRVSPVLTPWFIQTKAIHEAINEDIFEPVLGRGLDPDQLWDAYGRTLRVFSYLSGALSALFDELKPQPEFASAQMSKAIHEWAAPLFNDEEDIDSIMRVALANLRRNQKVVARLEKRGCFDKFLRSQKGGVWVSASYGFSWGLLGLRYCSKDPDRISQEDLYFCLTLIKVGPLDAFAFVRAFELDLLDREDSSDDFEPGEMHPEIAQLEAEEHDEHERLLAQIEDRGEY